MTGFLEGLARHYCSSGAEKLGEMCFVFPNRRSQLFFCKYAGKCGGKAFFSPKMFTINDLFAHLSGLRCISRIEALGILYRHYAELMPRRRDGSVETFDEFVFWGDIILGDFDDVDKCLVDASRLFANIKDIHDLDCDYSFLSERQLEAVRSFWSSFCAPSAEPRKLEGRIDKKEVFRTTWEILYPLYVSFKAELAADGKAYEGMIYRQVAESLKSGGESRNDLISRLKELGPIVFVGLNALNECEKALLSAVRDELDGVFFWDFCGDMVTDDANKSSHFLKDTVKEYPSSFSIDCSKEPGNKNYRVISVPSAVGQARIAAEIVADLASSPDFVPEETAIVLPDESLLQPVLNSIPDSVEDVNVTMGYPLSGSNVAVFISLVDRLQKNMREKEGKSVFYCRDVFALFDHPFISRRKRYDELISSIKKNNVVYPAASELLDGSTLLSLLFRPFSDAGSYADYQTALLDEVQDGLSDIDKEFVFNYRKAVVQLSSLNLEMERGTWFKLLSGIVEGISIPFNGEPLAGLQIMGPLETRALDFKNIIILSCNEGTFPKSGVSGSFIPYNLRFGFNLPTYEFQDSISAYHFYRSIFRAENVVMLYDSRSDGMAGGEPSRFISQLKYHYNVPMKEEVSVSAFVSSEGSASLFDKVEKTPAVMEEVKSFFLGGRGRFSASSLNAYRKCPMNFYYTYVKGIRDEDDVVEELDAGQFGDVFHRTMQKLYQNHKGVTLTAACIRKMKEDEDLISGIIDGVMGEVCGKRSISGQNLILKQLIVKYVDKVLERDMDIAPFKFVDAERRMTSKLNIKAKDGDAESESTVTLCGSADRIDVVNGQLRIVDYKSGYVDDKELKMDPSEVDMDKLFTVGGRDSKMTIVFQLFFYALLGKMKNIPECGEYSPCIYSLRKIFDKAPVWHCIPDDKIVEFGERLEVLIAGIFNPEIPFYADSGNDSYGDGNCKFCNFKSICKKA